MSASALYDMGVWNTLNAMDPSYPWLHSDTQREREFYKYYDPIRALSEEGPSVTDIYADASSQPPPRSCPDKALTAFCQLGALRIGTRRCMLMFFDREYAYVLAEATRTLSLVDDNVHEFDDSLWLGFTIFKRGLSICEHTINTAPIKWNSGADPAHADAVYVVEDLGANVNFCDRPFVTGGPKARFYAGVPITTPAGVRIGAYCVLDDKPRPGLSPAEVDFMCQMGKTVMSHLEIVRARSDLGIGTKMLTGLGHLVSNSSAGIGLERTRKKRPLPQRRAAYAKKASPVNDAPPLVPQPPLENGVANSPEVPFSLRSNPPRKDSIGAAIASSLSVGSEPPTSHRDVATLTRERVQELFQTAAELLKKSLSVDGSLLLDASTHAYGGAVRPTSPDSEQDLVFNDRSGGTTPDAEFVPTASLDDIPCKVLGASPLELGHKSSISERFLRDLLKKYPRGKIWNFNAGENSPASETGVPQTPGVNGHATFQLTKEESKERDYETEELKRLFPEAQCLCLVGMWDAIRERWCAGTLVWTNSRSRVFSSNTELVFLIAFCDVLMAEITRLESHVESKAKSDFISSVSHELRTPLQGILCGIDLLQEQQSADLPIVNQIEMCGTTLLEVINNLLEFARINNLSNKSKNKTSQLPRKKHSNNRREGQSDSSPPLAADLHSFAKITEEVCDSTFYSHCWSKEQQSETNVDFILDISMDASVQSHVDVGAWKRICINVINNALKYTKEGYVAASLGTAMAKTGQSLAVLSVVDTGCGMSAEFLNNRLFRPFQQEDDLAQGTGLGMSLVRKLVEGLGGTIEVKSEKKIGTTITISVPLDTRRLSLNGADAVRPCEGVKISLHNPPPTENDLKRTARKLLTSTLEGSYLGLGAVTASSGASDVHMIFEDDVRDDYDVRKSAKPTIILCDSFSSAHRLRGLYEAPKPDHHVECIAQPYGPIRLAKAIQACLHVENEAGKSDSLVEHVQNQTVSIESQPIVESPPPLDQSEPLAMASPPVLSSLNAPRIVPSEDPTKPISIDSVLQPPAPAVPTAAPVEEAISDNTLQLRPQPIPSQTSSTLTNGLPPNTTTPETSISLLLVDDNPVNLRMLVAYADKNHYHRTTAANGAEAVTAYELAVLPPPTTQPPPLPRPIVILLDINMPIMDGFEAARRIRLLERNHNIAPATIIAVTGLGSTEAWKEAHACGMDLFLTKPVRPRELTGVLVGLVRGGVERGPRGLGAEVGRRGSANSL